MRIYAIGIYEIINENSTIAFQKSNHYEPKPNLPSLFFYDPFKIIEEKSLPQLSMADLNIQSIIHIEQGNEHHYFQRVTDKPFLIALSCKQKLEPKEAYYLLLNAQRAFLYPDSSSVKLESILMNPLGYIATDHLIQQLQQNANDLKQLSIQNIDKLLERGERIDKLNENAVNLTELTSQFKSRSNEQHKYCSYC